MGGLVASIMGEFLGEQIVTPLKTNMTGWNIHHLKMYFLLKIDIFQCHVSFQGCKVPLGVSKGVHAESAFFFTRFHCS